MARKIVYWTSTTIVAVMLLFALSYLTGNPQVVSGFTKAGPAAPQDNSWDCKTGCRNRPAVARVYFAEGMGSRGRDIRVGDGVSRPLLGGRWCADMGHTAGAPGPSDRLLRD
jgi:hypothetical protein